MTDERWHVLLPASIDDSGLDPIADIATFTSISEFGPEPDDLRPHIGQFDAVILRNAKLTEDVLNAATNLQIIAKHGVGLDNVDIPAATKHGIVVCNTPGANSRAVAEHAFTLLLAVNRQLLAADAETRRGEWNRSRWTANELRGKALGLFGCGNIAQEVAGLAADFGLDVFGYDPYVDESDLPDSITKVDSDTLFDRSDAVTVHTPLTDETRHAISTQELQRLSSEGIIVNTARGGVIDQEALVDALNGGTIAGAGLDVFAEEPPSADDPLFDHRNVIATPHIGGVTVEALERMARGAAENVRTLYNGSLPDTTVNPDCHE